MENLKGFLYILLSLLLGAIIKNLINIPIPDVVYGMFIFLVLLSIKLIKIKDVEEVSNMLLNNMSILFVPLGVSLMNEFESLGIDIIKIGIICIVTTFLVMVVTAKVVNIFQKKRSGRK